MLEPEDDILMRLIKLTRQKAFEFEVTKKPEDRIQPDLWSIANELEAFRSGLMIITKREK